MFAVGIAVPFSYFRLIDACLDVPHFRRFAPQG